MKLIIRIFMAACPCLVCAQVETKSAVQHDSAVQVSVTYIEEPLGYARQTTDCPCLGTTQEILINCIMDSAITIQITVSQCDSTGYLEFIVNTEGFTGFDPFHPNEPYPANLPPDEYMIYHAGNGSGEYLGLAISKRNPKRGMLISRNVDDGMLILNTLQDVPGTLQVGLN